MLSLAVMLGCFNAHDRDPGPRRCGGAEGARPAARRLLQGGAQRHGAGWPGRRDHRPCLPAAHRTARATPGRQPRWRAPAGGGDRGRGDRAQAGTAKVKLPDVNLLLYAVDEGSVRHEPARAWVEERLSGTETFALAWVVLLAFIRLTTSSRVFRSPLGTSEALDLVDGWLAQPCVTVVHPTSRHVPVLRDLLEPLGTAGNLT